jgi:hypothetical protein
MNLRTWRAGALAAGIAVVLLLATQKAAGQPNGTNASGTAHVVQLSVPTDPDTSNFPAIPESGSLIVLGSAFVIVAQQLRRLI